MQQSLDLWFEGFQKPILIVLYSHHAFISNASEGCEPTSPHSSVDLKTCGCGFSFEADQPNNLQYLSDETLNRGPE